MPVAACNPILEKINKIHFLPYRVLVNAMSVRTSRYAAVRFLVFSNGCAGHDQRETSKYKIKP